MRFQSNSAFTKLAPDLIADAYGPFSPTMQQLATTGDVQILGTPAAGNGWRIRNIQVGSVASTGQSNADIGVWAGTGGPNYPICWTPQIAGATSCQFQGDLFIINQVWFHCTIAVGGFASVFYRLEPIQP